MPAAPFRIKFSLGGNRGLDIFAAGSPEFVVVPCEAVRPARIEPTVTPEPARFPTTR